MDALTQSRWSPGPLVQHIVKAFKLLQDYPALGHPGAIHGTRELVVPDTGIRRLLG